MRPLRPPSPAEPPDPPPPPPPPCSYALKGPQYLGIGPRTELLDLSSPKEPGLGRSVVMRATLRMSGLTPGQAYTLYQVRPRGSSGPAWQATPTLHIPSSVVAPAPPAAGDAPLPPLPLLRPLLPRPWLACRLAPLPFS